MRYTFKQVKAIVESKGYIIEKKQEGIMYYKSYPVYKENGMIHEFETLQEVLDFLNRVEGKKWNGTNWE